MIARRALLVCVMAGLAVLQRAAPAEAQPEWPAKRVAVLVGANQPAPGRQPLLFGHDDATKMASVLTTVGGFRPQDVFVLKDPGAAELMRTLHTAADRLSDLPESLLYFYYSGHADEQALYPAGEPLPLSRLRAVMDQARVAVRIGMVDSCHGGAWTRAKGLRPDQPFQVRWPLSLDTEGSVLIASSSGLESAHESDQLRGSFFTHHFASGLRGAADRNANGEVTITEAFEYAKERTIRDTLKVAREPQHPSFAVNLRGRRDLVLSQISQSPSMLELFQRHGPLELVHMESGVALLELPEGARSVRLAVPPGVYLVRKKYPGSIVSKEVVVRPGSTTSIEENQLTLVGNQQLVAKSAMADPLRAAPPPPLPEPGPSGWVKLGAITGLSLTVGAVLLSYKFALDISRINQDLDAYRRYACSGSADVSCARDGTTRLPPIRIDESRYVNELQDEGKRFEGYQYACLGVATLAALASTPFVISWVRAATKPSAEERSSVALQAGPAWLQGPGFVLNARF
jgi:hypothetical protein